MSRSASRRSDEARTPTVYSHDDRCLCTEMIVALRALLGRIDFRPHIVDADEDAGLEGR